MRLFYSAYVAIIVFWAITWAVYGKPLIEDGNQRNPLVPISAVGPEASAVYGRVRGSGYFPTKMAKASECHEYRTRI